jgi:hypothetical protein
LAQPKRFQPVLGLGPDDDRLVPGPHQIAHGLVGRIGTVNRSELAGARQPGEAHTVAAIGFHPIPTPLGHQRGTHDHAVLAAPREMPVDPEAAGPGLVHQVQLPVWPAQRAHDLVERVAVCGNHPIMSDLALPAAVGHREVDRFLVDIHPHEHATVPQDLPPRVWRDAKRERLRIISDITRGRSPWLSGRSPRGVAHHAPPSRPPTHCGARAGGRRMSAATNRSDSHYV